MCASVQTWNWKLMVKNPKMSHKSIPCYFWGMWKIFLSCVQIWMVIWMWMALVLQMGAVSLALTLLLPLITISTSRPSWNMTTYGSQAIIILTSALALVVALAMEQTQNSSNPLMPFRDTTQSTGPWGVLSNPQWQGTSTGGRDVLANSKGGHLRQYHILMACMVFTQTRCLITNSSILAWCQMEYPVINRSIHFSLQNSLDPWLHWCLLHKCLPPYEEARSIITWAMLVLTVPYQCRHQWGHRMQRMIMVPPRERRVRGEALWSIPLGFKVNIIYRAQAPKTFGIVMIFFSYFLIFLYIMLLYITNYT